MLKSVIAIVAIVIALGVAGYVFLRGDNFYRIFNFLVAETRGVAVQRDVTYGPDPRQKLNIFTPEDAAENNPIVFFIYGGTWNSGEKFYYDFVGGALAQNGFTVVIPDYRLFPAVKWPDFLNDVARAYAWTARTLVDGAQQGNTEGQDTRRRLFVLGHSAGAHMAATLAFESKWVETYYDGVALKPDAFAGLSGPYTFNPTIDPLTKDAFATVQDLSHAQPATSVSAGDPPTLLLHGDKDTLVRSKNAVELKALLDESGVDASYKLIPGLNHVDTVSTLSWPLRSKGPVLDEVVAFFKRHTSRPAN